MASIPVASFSVGKLHKQMRLHNESGSESDCGTPPVSPKLTRTPVSGKLNHQKIGNFILAS